MISIRARLGWGLGGALGMVLILFGILFYVYLRYVLLSGFDAALYDKARLLAAGAEVVGAQQYDFEMFDPRMPELAAGRDAEYVEFWDDTCRAILRSPSLEGRDLVACPGSTEAPRFSDLMLPDGRRGRMVNFAFEPRPEEGYQVSAGAAPLRIAVAVTRGDIDHALGRILWGLILGAMVLTLALFSTLWWAIQLGLRPIEAIAGQVSALGAAKLSHRLDTTAIPGELRPIVDRLNELLARLEGAFSRERRFTADAAHELRTPVAELRTLTDVGLMEFGEDTSEIRGYFLDAAAIASHLERLITGLLMLARFESENAQLALAPLDLAALLQLRLRGLELPARRPDLAVEMQLPERALVLGSDALAGVLVDNLLSNAATHAEMGGTLSVVLRQDGSVWRLQIANTVSGLNDEDMAHLFEPFWRKSRDRSGQQHLGLGLALAAECARMMGVEMRASLPASNMIRMALAWQAHGRER